VCSMRRIEILPRATRHKRPLWGEFIFALDSQLRRREGVFEYSHKPDCIFRAQFSRLSSDVLLSDGTFGRLGDRVIDLHFWNEQSLSHLWQAIPWHGDAASTGGSRNPFAD
jgi:hypothetical protein